jgi:hypothetical protein
MATTMTTAPSINGARQKLRAAAAQFSKVVDPWWDDCTAEDEATARTQFDAAVHDIADELRNAGHRVRARIGVAAPGVFELWEVIADGNPIWRYAPPDPND